MPAGIYEGSYSFEYGPTTAYGLHTPAILLPPGLAAQAVSATVTGLQPGSPTTTAFVVIGHQQHAGARRRHT